MTDNRVGVIGAGTMGNGICHVFARAGFDVRLHEIDAKSLERGIEAIRKNLGREVSAGKITQTEADAALSRVHKASSYGDFANCGVVVEAATEKFDVKVAIFRELSGVVGPDAVLASNTSSISITRLAATVKHPERFIGMHFFNPVPVMKLVEVIRGMATSDAVNQAVVDLARKLGKTPLEVNDSPGFVSNRVLMPMLNEAMFAVMDGVATPEAVDEIFKLGMAHPMGPLALADFVGLDVCLHIMRVLQEGLGDAKFRPCPLLVRMVDAGWTGRKSGRGFYTYPPKS